MSDRPPVMISNALFGSFTALPEARDGRPDWGSSSTQNVIWEIEGDSPTTVGGGQNLCAITAKREDSSPAEKVMRCSGRRHDVVT